MDQRLFRSWIPHGGHREAVVALHGMISHAGWFEALGEKLLDQGIALHALNRRGNGTAQDMPGTYDLPILQNDIHDALRMAAMDADRIILLAWCFGVVFAIPAAAQFPVDGLFLCAPGNFVNQKILDRLNSLAAKPPIDGYYPLHFDPIKDFTDDERVREWIRNDGLKLTRLQPQVFSFFDRTGAALAEALPKVNCPRVCIMAQDDRIVDNDRTVAAFNRHSGYAIEWRPGNHDLIFLDTDWISRRISRFFDSESRNARTLTKDAG